MDNVKDPLSENIIKELLKTRSNGLLYHRESQTLEFKEQFNYAGWSEYLRDFAAFANNNGGYLVFGVSNNPRKLIGLSEKAIKMFEDVDEQFISGEINKLFSPYIKWRKEIYKYKGKIFGIFYIWENHEKPVIAKQDKKEIKNGEIYYRYAGRTQKIAYAELNNIIQDRIRSVNDKWTSLISKMAKIGPANAAILDTEKGVIEKDKDKILILDKKLLPKINFIKEGSLLEQDKIAMKIVGDVVPVNTMEVIKHVRQNLWERYPFSYKQLEKMVKKRVPYAKQTDIYRIIKDNKIKDNEHYSAYNFRSKQHEEKFKSTGKLPTGTPSLYNQAAVDFIVKCLEKINTER